MLLRLALRDFVLIDEAEIEFDGGFCAFTGETGAGKSLLVGALSLLAGGRAPAGLIKSGGKAAEIEAFFDLTDLPLMSAWLKEHNLDSDDKMLVRRIICGDARKSRAFINGRQVPLSQMAEGVSGIIEICGQHAHYSLLKLAAHRELLDSCAAAENEVAAVSSRYDEWRHCRKTLEEVEKNAEGLAAKRDALRADCEELAALRFSADKWEEYNARLTRLANISDLAESCTAALLLLEGEDGVSEKMAQANRRLTTVVRHDEQLAQLNRALDEALQLTNETARDLYSFTEKLRPDPTAENEAETFISEAHRLARKHLIADPEKLGDCWRDKQDALSALEKETDIKICQTAEASARKALNEAAAKLSAKRHPAAKTLAKEILSLLCNLSMPQTQLAFVLSPLETPGAHGGEDIALKFSTQENTPLKNIAEIASGGELSRLGLAVQIAAGRFRPRPVVIFDEVDSGIGGATASVVGRLLQQLADTRQVLCVTHLAQVAAHADTHWRVKSVLKGKTRQASVERLNNEARVEEIARMTGGVKVGGQAALAHAAALRDESKRPQAAP